MPVDGRPVSYPRETTKNLLAAFGMMVAVACAVLFLLPFVTGFPLMVLYWVVAFPFAVLPGTLLIAGSLVLAPRGRGTPGWGTALAAAIVLGAQAALFAYIWFDELGAG